MTRPALSALLAGAFRQGRALRGALVLLVALCAVGEAAAQTPGAFTRIGFGARGIGMGSGLVADVFSGTASPFYNPALSPLATQQTVDAAAAFLSLDRELQHAQFAFALPPRAGAAFGIIRAGVGEIDGRDASGYHTGELSTEESVVFATFGVRMGERVTGGFGLRFYRSDLLQGVSAPVTIGISAGLTARLSERLALGLAVDDLLARYSYDTSLALGGGGSRTSDRFPVRARLGGAYRLGERALLTAEVEAQSQGVEVRRLVTREIGGQPQTVLESQRQTYAAALGRLGAEVWLAEPFAVRAGVDRIGQDGLAGVSPALGFAVRRQLGELGVRADYAAVLEPHALGVMHVVAIRLDL
jgi:hypothetical protein